MCLAQPRWCHVPAMIRPDAQLWPVAVDIRLATKGAGVPAELIDLRAASIVSKDRRDEEAAIEQRRVVPDALGRINPWIRAPTHAPIHKGEAIGQRVDHVIH